MNGNDRLILINNMVYCDKKTKRYGILMYGNILLETELLVKVFNENNSSKTDKQTNSMKCDNFSKFTVLLEKSEIM